MRTRVVPPEELDPERSLLAADYIKPTDEIFKPGAVITPGMNLFGKPGDMKTPPSEYEAKIIRAFKDASKNNGPGQGASPAEVTDLLFQRGELSKLDSCIDIADLMKDLRKQGRL